MRVGVTQVSRADASQQKKNRLKFQIRARTVIDFTARKKYLE